MEKIIKNVLGASLDACCFEPRTGFYRDGFCKTGEDDYGTHVVCAIMTVDFLAYTKTQGNDLSTPIPQWNFPGLKEGDQWCLCVTRWLQAERAGNAPNVKLNATHEKALDYTTLALLQKYAV